MGVAPSWLWSLGGPRTERVWTPTTDPWPDQTCPGDDERVEAPGVGGTTPDSERPDPLVPGLSSPGGVFGDVRTVEALVETPGSFLYVGDQDQWFEVRPPELCRVTPRNSACFTGQCNRGIDGPSCNTRGVPTESSCDPGDGPGREVWLGPEVPGTGKGW